LLPVLDDFDRFVKSSREQTNPATLCQAVDLIHRKILGALESEGLSPIESISQPFDATLHEAVAQFSTKDCPEGCIYTEIEKGYRLGDKIIRHAKVVVAKPLDPTQADSQPLQNQANEGAER